MSVVGTLASVGRCLTGHSRRAGLASGTHTGMGKANDCDRDIYGGPETLKRMTVNERLRQQYIDLQHNYNEAINAAVSNERLTRARVVVMEREVARVLVHLGLEPLPLEIESDSRETKEEPNVH